jgi:hypothetical protein
LVHPQVYAFGQISEDRRVDQDSHREVDIPDATGLQYHVGGQQRVSAEPEEILFTADLIKLENIGPDHRELTFCLRLEVAFHFISCLRWRIVRGVR